MSEEFDYHLDKDKINEIFQNNKKLDDIDIAIFDAITKKAKSSYIYVDENHQPKFWFLPSEINKQLGNRRFKQKETIRNRVKRLVRYGLLVVVDEYRGYYSFSSEICPLSIKGQKQPVYMSDKVYNTTVNSDYSTNSLTPTPTKKAYHHAAVNSDYYIKLRNPKWQRRKSEIMLRDNFKCQICGDTENTLNVHHIRYVKGRKPWEYDDNELITLCEKCHERRKSFDDINKRTVALLSRGIMKEEIIGLLQCAIDAYDNGNAHAIEEMVKYVANCNKNMEKTESSYFFNDYNFLDELAKRREETGIIKQDDNLPF